MGEYLKAVLENKEQATLLVGPYGKGKSHLLLVLLAVLSMERTPESESVINELIDKVSKTDEVGERVSEYIGQVWDKKRFLPVNQMPIPVLFPCPDKSYNNFLRQSKYKVPTAIT